MFPKKRILIDIRSTQEGPNGLARYCLNIANMLYSNRGEMADYYFLLEENRAIPDELIVDPMHLIYGAPKKVSVKRIVWENTVLPCICKNFRFDIYHGLDYFVPLIGSYTKYISTFHDAIAFSRRDSRRKIDSLMLRLYLRAVAANATHICTVSRDARGRICHFLPNIKSKISVIYNGVEEKFFLGRENCKERYILYYGGFKANKRFDLLIEAVAHMKDLYLVVIGEPGDELPEIERHINASDVFGRIRFLGSVSDKVLIEYLRKALLFVYPSEEEGFGLPLLEAMASGTAVVCQASGAMKEVTAGNAIYYEKGSTASLIASISYLMCSDDLRTRLERNGKSHAMQYSWLETIANIKKVYQNV